MSARTWTPGRLLGVALIVAIPVVGLSLIEDRHEPVNPKQRSVDAGPAYVPPPLPRGRKWPNWSNKLWGDWASKMAR